MAATGLEGLSKLPATIGQAVQLDPRTVRDRAARSDLPADQCAKGRLWTGEALDPKGSDCIEVRGHRFMLSEGVRERLQDAIRAAPISALRRALA